MPRVSKTDQERGYLKAFWEEIRAAETDYHGAVSMFANASARVGVTNYRLVFTGLMGGEENLLNKAAVAFNYPDAREITLAAALWKAATQLHDMVDEYATLQRSRVQNNA